CSLHGALRTFIGRSAKDGRGRVGNPFRWESTPTMFTRASDPATRDWRGRLKAGRANSAESRPASRQLSTLRGFGQVFVSSRGQRMRRLTSVAKDWPVLLERSQPFSDAAKRPLSPLTFGT